MLEVVLMALFYADFLACWWWKSLWWAAVWMFRTASGVAKRVEVAFVIRPGCGPVAPITARAPPITVTNFGQTLSYFAVGRLE